MVPLIFPTIICAGEKRTAIQHFLLKFLKISDLIIQIFNLKKELQYNLLTSVADPHPTFHFDADPDPDLTFHCDVDPDPDPTFNCDADADPEPTTHFFPELYPPMIENDPLKVPPFHFDAEPDPAFHFDADADPGEQ